MSFVSHLCTVCTLMYILYVVAKSYIFLTMCCVHTYSKLQSLDFQPGEGKHICQIVEAVWSGLSACNKHYYSSSSLSLLLDELLVLSDRAVASCEDSQFVQSTIIDTVHRVQCVY